MKTIGEAEACLIAISTSILTLLGTFGLAAVMRSQQLTSAASAAGAQEMNANRLTKTAADGRHLFLMNCAHCHGDDARGDEGPDLHNLHRSDARIHQVITAGIKGEMPSFTKKLNDSDIKALTAYLRTLS